MRQIAFLALLLVIWTAVAAVSSACADAGRDTADSREVRTVLLDIEGMQCEACATVIQNALQKTKGVKKATVARKKGQATVTFDSAQTSVAKLIDAIEKAQGMAPYRAREHKE